MKEGKLYKVIFSHGKCTVQEYGVYDVEGQKKIALEIKNDYIEKETSLEELHKKGIITDLFYIASKNSEFFDNESWFFVIEEGKKVFSSELYQNERYVYGETPGRKAFIKDKLLMVASAVLSALILFVVVKILMLIFKL